MDARQTRLLVESVLLGLVGALAVELFSWLMNLSHSFFMVWLAGYSVPEYAAPAPPGARAWLIPVATTLGGLLSGLLVFSLAPESEGHGTDAAIRSFHQEGGAVRGRVPIIKTVASAITIGSGGSAGREGPTALIAAGIGSLYASWSGRPDQDRRILLLAGMAAGLSAMFRSPIGTAIFAVEVLYAGVEFEAAALLYTLLAAVVAFAFSTHLLGSGPLFAIPTVEPPDLFHYPWYLGLGLLAGLVAAVVPAVFYGTRDLFHKIPGPPHLKPALGGLGVGLLAMQLPHVLGGGYGTIRAAIAGELAVGLMGVLIVAKLVAFSLTVSSGGSGGVFAPTLFIGAMLGGVVAHWLGAPPAALVVIGMAAVFGGAARVPMATILMVTEMTQGYQLLGPAALAVLTSYVLCRGLKAPSLYEAQVPEREDSPVHGAGACKASEAPP